MTQNLTFFSEKIVELIKELDFYVDGMAKLQESKIHLFKQYQTKI